MTAAFPAATIDPARREDEGGVHKHSRRSMVIGVLLVFTLAYYSPVEMVDADPGLALLAAQALIDNHSLRLDPYVDHAGLAYDLRTDYRVRRYAGAMFPHSLGVPVLSVPAVWLANRFGWSMLDQTAEFAMQNLLSAAACALLFLMLFRLCRLYVDPGSSLVIASFSMLGTSLMSTGATGLWNSDYSLLFVTAALYVIVSRRHSGMSAAALGYLGVLLLAGFFCRPSTGFLALAVTIYLLDEKNRVIRIAAVMGLLALLLALAIPWMVPLPWMAAHYSPMRLQLTYPLVRGLDGILLSPSRGLFVFSPFIGLLAVASVRYLRPLARDRVFRLCAVWIAIHTLAVATNEGKWWGGHSYGPRMMIDVIPAFVVVTCIVWRHLRRSEARPARVGLAAAYLVLGAFAIAVHTGQGLFNQATRLWNMNPDVDRDTALVFDWRYPQFLATAGMLEARIDDFERRFTRSRLGSLPPYAFGDPIRHDSDDVIFTHWYPPEREWRWTRGEAASTILWLPDFDRDALYVLQLYAGSLGLQRVAVRVNEAFLASVQLSRFEPSWAAVAVPGELLQPNAPNAVELRLSAPSSTDGDSRQLGLALRQLRIVGPVAAPPEVSYADDPYFGTGFGSAEEGWRWTDGPRATVALPIADVAPRRRYVLVLRARPNGAQRVQFVLNGSFIGDARATGEQIDSLVVPVPAEVLLPNSINRLELRLPDASRVAGDSRQLGLAVISVTVATVADPTPAR